MSDIAVSVVMPSYNDGAWLRRAVESVLCQASAVPGLELLLVDDASTDAATRAEQEALASQYSGELVLLRQAQNGGPARARNAGIAAARGQWIAFLDGDDYWLPGGLAARWAVVQQCPEAAFIGTDYRLESATGQAEPQGFNASRPRPRAAGCGLRQRAGAAPAAPGRRLHRGHAVLDRRGDGAGGPRSRRGWFSA